MVRPKTNHQVINEMLLRKPDETIRVSISFTPPPGFYPWPHGISGKQLDDYYSQNRIPYENHTRQILDMLAGENVSIFFPGPYPTTGSMEKFRSTLSRILMDDRGGDDPAGRPGVSV